MIHFVKVNEGKILNNNEANERFGDNKYSYCKKLSNNRWKIIDIVFINKNNVNEEINNKTIYKFSLTKIIGTDLYMLPIFDNTRIPWWKREKHSSCTNAIFLDSIKLENINKNIKDREKVIYLIKSYNDKKINFNQMKLPGF